LLFSFLIMKKISGKNKFL
ncbi:DNA helicase, partial [Escherichia coli EC1864]